MLRLRYKTEDWRDKLIPIIDKACRELGIEASETADSYWNYAADQLCSDTLDLLGRRGVEFEQAHQQSRGAFVIVQDGEPHEIEVFDECLAEAMSKVEEYVYQLAGDAAFEERKYLVGGLVVYMAARDARKWNEGLVDEIDPDAVTVCMPNTEVEGVPEMLTLREAKLDPAVAEMLEDAPAELIG